MSEKNTDSKLDELINKIASGTEKKKSNNAEKNINFDEVDFEKLDTQTKKVYSDLFTGMPDLYKLVGADMKDSDAVVKKKCTEKLAKYHPDKLAPLLVKIKDSKEREDEKKKYLLQYKLIKEAYQTLSNSDKRKFYDMQKKAVDGKNFLKQKNSFEEFKKLQESEINETNKKNSQNLFEMKMLELDAKRGFDRKQYDEKKPIEKEEALKKMKDLLDEREMTEIEYAPKNRFETEFKLVDFNKLFEKNKKHEERSKKPSKSSKDSSLVTWEGVSAMNDVGLNGSSNYVSINADYEDVYTDTNFEESTFANKLNSDDDNDSNFSLSDVSDDGIDVEYVTNFDKNKEKTMTEYERMEKERMNDDEMYKDRQYADTKWKTVLDNPFNVSAQMGVFVGDNMKTLEGPKKKTKIGKEMAEAYKQLIYDNKNNEK